MNRQILCRECGERIISKPLLREDIAMGFKRRIRYIDATNIPAGHGMYALRCDYCDKVVTREICIATTYWRPKKEPEPDDWESHYGNIIPAATVAAGDKLAT